jgi:hypothetical protein
MVVSEGEKRRDVILVSRNPTPALAPATKQETASQPNREADQTSLSPLVWVGGATLTAGLVVGTLAGTNALAKASEADKNCPDKVCPPPYHATLDSLSTWSTVSTVGFVVAGAGLITMVLGFALPSKAPKLGFLRLYGSF